MDALGYEIKIAHFEGPFDLLLFFIERDELNIHDIPISKITNDFLEYLHQLHTLNMGVASEFILMAATLMKIKAKTLLPRYEIEEESIDLKEDLVQKLIAYKKFKNICEDFRVFEEHQFQMKKKGQIPFEISQALKDQEHIEELSSFNLYKLLKIYEKSIHQYQKRNQEVRHTVEKYPYTIETQKSLLLDLLSINNTLDFQMVLAQSENKVHFVYNFLALLEMLQQQIIRIEQQQIEFNNFKVQYKGT